MKNIAIVGGGIGGLTTALLLSQQGHAVTVFEQHSELGGRAAFIGNGTYRVDKGPTIVLLPETIRQILAEGGLELSDNDLHRCDPLYAIHFDDGTIYRKYPDLDRQLAELERVFPGEKDAFLRYLSTLESWYNAGKPAFLEKTFTKLRHLLNWKTIKLLYKLRVYANVRAFTATFFRSPKLQQAYSLQTLYIGGAPHQTPALYSLIPYAEHAFGIWYFKGGYASLITRIEHTLVARGVQIHKQTRVDRLQLDGNRCTGLINNNHLQRFDDIVFNGDFPSLAGVMDVKMKPYRGSGGCLLIYLGIDRKYEEADVHQFILPDDLDGQLSAIFNRGDLPTDPSFYVFNPSRIDTTLAPEGHSVLYFLIPVPNNVKRRNWVTDPTKIVDHVIAKAESSLFPGLREHIQWKHVRTPDEAEQDGLYQGGSFGIAPTLGQSAYFRPQVKPYVYENLYAVGASVHPGGGVPIVMQGAKLVADLINKE
jgi:phytoene desaturase